LAGWSGQGILLGTSRWLWCAAWMTLASAKAAFSKAKPQNALAGIEHLEAKTGKIALSGRYHRPPKEIDDDYEVAATVLGSGYNGVVRQATAKYSKGLKFAIKAFKLDGILGDKKTQLESEVEIFLCMDHPHITRLYDVYESERYLYLVMECMEGGELFDRVTELKRFSERDAADAVWQMLLALNYIHSHGIVHRDVKLENFLYDSKGSHHLKLIDFGFSKMWDPNIKMHVSCGTLSYVAPEVLEKSYTSQCDLWSLGVIAFILLGGYMPFSGKDEKLQMENIAQGKYVLKPEKWNGVSEQAKNFVKSVLRVDPNQRLTAEKALEHEWISRRANPKDAGDVPYEVIEALRQFGTASKFRRCCLGMMAWSLSNEERAEVRADFIRLDKNQNGTITLAELRQVMVDKYEIPDGETQNIFHALDTNGDEEIHYSDFLAAMVSTRIALHDDLLRHAFAKFDVDNSKFITVENLREILGDSSGSVDELIQEADLVEDNKISYPEFVAFLKKQPLEANGDDALLKVIDKHLDAPGRQGYQKGAPLLTPKNTRESLGTGKGDRNRCAKGTGVNAKTKCSCEIM